MAVAPELIHRGFLISWAEKTDQKPVAVARGSVRRAGPCCVVENDRGKRVASLGSSELVLN
jgi:hypothetical protein